MSTRLVFGLLLAAALTGASTRALGQAVVVTLRLDTNRIAAGSSTVLHVYAQVAPAFRADAERIFSWYVDVLNTNGPVAAANYAALEKPASDNDPLISSTGVSEGANRRGIYDTFFGLAGAGVDQPVELMRIPVSGLAGGRTRFQVRAGTGVPLLANDFIVAPLLGGIEWTGGDYGSANADLEVIQESCAITLSISPLTPPGPAQRFLLSFTPCPGYDHFVDVQRPQVGPSGWQVLPGAPHNSGSVTVTNNPTPTFYRVRSVRAGGGGELRLTMTPLSVPNGSTARYALTFTPAPGLTHTLEYQDNLLLGGVWLPLPGSPHNSGSATVTNTVPGRLFRVRATP